MLELLEVVGVDEDLVQGDEVHNTLAKVDEEHVELVEDNVLEAVVHTGFSELKVAPEKIFCGLVTKSFLQLELCKFKSGGCNEDSIAKG